MRIVDAQWRIILLLCFFCTATLCSESPQERLQRLNQWIEAGRLDDARAEINTLLTETNKELSTPLDEEQTNRILRRSLDGSTIAWLQEDEMHFRRGEATGHVGIQDNAIDMTLSYSGRFGVVLHRLEQGCGVTLISVLEEESLESPVDQLPCDHSATISDDGRILYTVKDGSIVPLPVNGSLPGDVAEIPQSAFQPKYKKVENRFALYSVGERDLLILFGIAGYYNAYYYPGRGNQVQKNDTVIAFPMLFQVYSGEATIHLDEEEDTEATPTESEDLPDRFGLRNAQAFVYTGTAGKWQLQGMRFGERLAVLPGFDAKPAPATELAYVRERGEFMVLKDEELYYWNPRLDETVRLPLLARNFELYDGGLVYVDILGRIYLRQSPFSEMEIELVKLRDRADELQSALNTEG